MIFFHKIERAIFTKVGFSLIFLLHLFLTTKRYPSDVEPSYRPIQSAVYFVGVSKDCSCFKQMIDYNSKNLVWIFTKIDASGCPTSVPNFSWIGV